MDKFIRQHDPAYHAYMANDNAHMKTSAGAVIEKPAGGETTLAIQDNQQTTNFNVRGL